MLLKKKQKQEIKEFPLSYWEEYSYMLALVDNDTELKQKEIVNRISKIKDVTIKRFNYDIISNVFYVDVKYYKENYQIGFFYNNFSLPNIYLTSAFYFKEEEKEKLKNVNKALSIFTKFNKDAKRSFHLELKIADAVVPDLIGLVDESAERLLPAKWVKLSANTNTLPSPSDIFNIQVVYNDNEVWLHTHGLSRCGITELEILKSNKKNLENHYNIIKTYATCLLDEPSTYNPREESIMIGLINGKIPIIVTCMSWTKAINLYDKLEMGDIKDRFQGHNSVTSPIFIYRKEEDRINHKLSKVTDLDSSWSKNQIFFLSEKETERMRELAIERFDYLKKIFNKDNKIVIKIGLKCDLKEDIDREHIWFELTELKSNKFKAKLTQEPFNISYIHKGDEKWFSVEDITDWIAYTEDYEIHPSDVYLLDK